MTICLQRPGCRRISGRNEDRTFGPHEAFSVGEVFNEKDEELLISLEITDIFPVCLTLLLLFSAQAARAGTTVKQSLLMIINAAASTLRSVGDIGFLSNIIENHDEPRGVSHYIPEGEVSIYSKKMLAVMYFMLKGLPFIYQGQEIGMENMKFSSIDQIDDISTIDEYHVALNAGCTREEALKCISIYSRDNARTPMQWDCTENAGFTSGTPWLSVNPNYHEINVKSQQNDPDSLLSFYKKLTALRKDPDYKETIVYGNLIPYLEDQHNLMAYFRKRRKNAAGYWKLPDRASGYYPSGQMQKRAAEQLSGDRYFRKHSSFKELSGCHSGTVKAPIFYKTPHFYPLIRKEMRHFISLFIQFLLCHIQCSCSIFAYLISSMKKLPLRKLFRFFFIFCGQNIHPHDVASPDRSQN